MHRSYADGIFNTMHRSVGKSELRFDLNRDVTSFQLIQFDGRRFDFSS